MKTTQLLELVCQYASPGVFNPYSDFCEHHDRPDAAKIRLENLRLTLRACIEMKVDTIWIARDLGYRGGRRTGIALTDEAHLTAFGTMLDIELTRATKGPPVAERTAATVWEIIKAFDKPIFLWNVFPFHPHVESLPFTNRCHTRAERKHCEPILRSLLDILKPTTVVAIGNDAEIGLSDLGIKASRVRHPSYGGKSDFISGLAALYGFPLSSQGQQALAF